MESASGSRRSIVVVALLLAVFMSAMEATVVGTVMPTVVADLGGLLLYGWVSSSYLLASTVSVPLYGKLADLYGRRPMLALGIIIFLLGSIWSGFATSIEWLIAARTLQGIGAGAIQPVTFTILGDLYTLKERGRIQAFFGMVWGLAGAFGPFLGGLIVESLSWRWVFWINIPFGIASCVVLFAAFHERHEQRKVRLDWLGALLLTLGSVALLLAAQRTMLVVFVPLTAVLLGLFVVVEKRASEPVVPLDMAFERSVFVACLSAILLGASMTGAVTFLPLLAQGVIGASPTEAGSTIAPMILGWPLAAAFTSRAITRIGFRLPIQLGAGVIAIALGLLALMAEHASRDLGLWPLRGCMFVFGSGMGFASTALLLAVQTSVGAEQRGVATALNIFSRSIGGAIGVGALGAIFSLIVGAQLPEEVVAGLLDRHRGEVAPETLSALADGLRPVFRTLAALGVLNAIIVAFYPKPNAAPGASNENLSAPSPAH